MYVAYPFKEDFPAVNEGNEALVKVIHEQAQNRTHRINQRNYAQELRKKLEGKGLTDEEIERIITRDLGHERRSMARHYLGV